MTLKPGHFSNLKVLLLEVSMELKLTKITEDIFSACSVLAKRIQVVYSYS